MKNKIKFNNKNVLIASVFVIFVFLIALFVFSGNYALEEFGKINLNCDKASASSGEKITCEVTGTINTAGAVSGIDSKIMLSNNLEFESFTVDNTEWVGDGDDMRLILYTENNKSGTFNIGTLVVKVKEDTVNTVESISFTDTLFTDANYDEYELMDKSVSISTPTFTSDVYDLTKNYIVTNTNSIENIISNISVSNDTSVVVTSNGENVTNGVIDENSIVKIMHGDNIVKTYNIVYFGSSTYDLTKDYIVNTFSEEEMIDEIDVINAELNVENNKLIVSYNTEIVKEYNIFNISSSKYIIDSLAGYLLIDSAVSDSIIGNITHSNNMDLSVENNKLNIVYNNENIYSFEILTLYSEKYVIDLKDSYVYIKNDEINNDITNNITTNGSLSLDTDVLKLSYNSTNILELDVINIKSNSFKLDLENDYIYSGSINEENNIIDGITTNGDVKIENSKLILSFGSDTLEQLNWHYFTSTYNISNNNILVTDNVNYNEFISKFNFNDLNNKVYDLNNNEVTTGIINNGYGLKMFVGDTLVDTYQISVEYFKVNGLTLDEENKIISGVNINEIYTTILSKIDTNGEVTFTDVNGKVIENSSKVETGDIMKVKLTSRTLEYKIAVLGDVTGDGKINVGDVAKLYQYLKEKIEMEKVYQVAGDVTFENTIAVNDVSKLYSYLKEKITTLN